MSGCGGGCAIPDLLSRLDLGHCWWAKSLLRGLSPTSMYPSIVVAGPTIECCLLIFVVFGTR